MQGRLKSLKLYFKYLKLRLKFISDHKRLPLAVSAVLSLIMDSYNTFTLIQVFYFSFCIPVKVVVLSWSWSYIRHRNNPLVINILTQVQSIKLLNKRRLVLFTLLGGTPNYVLIREDSRSGFYYKLRYFIYILIFSMVIICTLTYYPAFILTSIPTLMYLILNYAFALLYETSYKFREFIVRVLFGNSTILTKSYFTFF